RSGTFAQDIRSTGGSKSWNVAVGTDQPNTTITFSWDQVRAVPKNVRLTIKDQATDQTVDMRTRSSITFNTGQNVQGRKYTITASQGVNMPVRISNLMVQTPSRAVGTN